MQADPHAIFNGKFGDQEEKRTRLLQEPVWEVVIQHSLSGVRAEAKP